MKSIPVENLILEGVEEKTGGGKVTFSLHDIVDSINFNEAVINIEGEIKKVTSIKFYIKEMNEDDLPEEKIFYDNFCPNCQGTKLDYDDGDGIEEEWWNCLDCNARIHVALDIHRTVLEVISK
ncbi:MAG: hypothetical protein ACOCQR_02930 [bacterium]